MKSLIRLGGIVSILAALNSAALADETYTFNQSHSTIGFRIHQFLGSTSGKFKTFDGRIAINREEPDKSSVDAKIDVRSIDTGNVKRDTHLRSPELFDVYKFPEITFKSRSVKQTGPERGDIVGDLTMHGVTKPVTLHVKLLSSTNDTSQTRWTVTAELKRRDFGLMFGGAAEAVSGIGQAIAVSMEIEAMRAQ